MSWLDGWTHRFPVMVDNTASAGTADKDVTFTIPKGLRDFWDNVLNTGYDVRVTKADGLSLLDFRNTFVAATKSCTINALGDSGATASWGPPVGNEAALLWVYVGNAAAADASVVTAPVSPLSGYLTAALPSSIRIDYAPEIPEATVPANVVSKAAADQLTVWVDFSAALEDLAKKSSGSSASGVAYEELLYANFQVQQAGVDVASMFTESATRYSGRGRVRVTVKAGTSGQDYTGIVTVGTTNPDETGSVRVLVQRFLIQVRTVDE